MKREKFLNEIQQYTARVAVSASAPTRGKGSAGVAEAARKFLGERLILKTFGAPDSRAFKRDLDRSTEQLLAAFPEQCANWWGLSRKLLNIFLRDCFYTTYLDAAYGLHAAEGLFEIPLDSITANQIRQRESKLPQWKGVRKLTKEVSSEYQDAAMRIAESKDYGVARVHLDAYWWGERKQSRKDHGIER